MLKLFEDTSGSVKVREGPLRGVLFLPPNPGPAVITIYGGVNKGKVPEDRLAVGEGVEIFPKIHFNIFSKNSNARAALLASYGFVTLALAYFGVEGLPAVYSSFEMSYFERAVDFLLSQHQVKDSSKVGVFGQSMGGSLALAMMSCLGEKVGCCVVAGSQFIFSPGKARAAELKFFTAYSIYPPRTLLLQGKFGCGSHPVEPRARL